MNSTIKRTIFDPQNSLSFDPKVIQKMIVLLLKDIDGILLTEEMVESNRLFNSADENGIHVEVGTKQVAIDLNITCEFGKNIPTIFQKTLDILTVQLKEMTGLSLVELNIHVDDIVAKETVLEQTPSVVEPLEKEIMKPVVESIEENKQPIESADDLKIAEQLPQIDAKSEVIDAKVVDPKPKKTKSPKVSKPKKEKAKKSDSKKETLD